jgi:hypothetical protein
MMNLKLAFAGEATIYELSLRSIVGLEVAWWRLIWGASGVILGLVGCWLRIRIGIHVITILLTL